MKFLLCVFLFAVSLSTAHIQAGDEAARYFPHTGAHLAAEGVQWDYSRSGAHGVNHWGDANSACLGQRQSPIDLRNAVYNSSLSALHIDWQAWPQRTLINTGHAIQVNEATNVATSTMHGGPLMGEYKAIQFHAHAVSEHTINGGAYPLEIHVVHLNMDASKAVQTDPAELAVVGLFFAEGEHNAALDTFFNNLHSIPNKDNSVTIDLNLASLLPHNRDYYTYPGSLTTPGCRETVTWIVMKEVQYCSGEQIEKLREIMHLEQNNRPTQPLNGRVVQTNVAGGDGGMVPNGSGSVVNINFNGLFNGMKFN